MASECSLPTSSTVETQPPMAQRRRTYLSNALISVTNKTAWSSGMLSHGDVLPLTPTNGRDLHNYVKIFRVRLRWKDTEDGA